jgi:hypothetical protein
MIRDLPTERRRLLRLAWDVLEADTNYRLRDDYGYCATCHLDPGDEDDHEPDCIVMQARAVLAPILFPEWA